MQTSGTATVATVPLPDDLSGIVIESLDVPATTVDAASPVLGVSAPRGAEDVHPSLVKPREHGEEEGALRYVENRDLVERGVVPPCKEDRWQAGQEGVHHSASHDGGTAGVGDVASSKVVVGSIASPRFSRLLTGSPRTVAGGPGLSVAATGILFICCTLFGSC